jgi:alkylation response protein AidB-like acyl-CoA dehydrogenase
MNLALSSEQQELANGVRRFAREEITPARILAWEGEGRGMDDSFWSAVAGLGWPGIALPTSAGGSGLGLVDVACVLFECARGLLPLAVAGAIRGADALAFLAPEASELTVLANGEARLALALDEENVRQPRAYRCRLEGERLHGEKWYVQQAHGSDLLLVAAREGVGLSLVLARRRDAALEPLRGFAAGDAQSIVRFDGAPIVRRLCDAARGEELLRRIVRRQIALALAEMLGGMDAVLEMTVAYVKEREQFGQKIAVFQAVQHQVADMATAYTAARHLAWQAITRVAEERDEPIDLPAAAAWVGASFKQLAVTGHHLHGGAGFVVEHPLHWHSERAQSLCLRWTPEPAALAEVATVLLGE